MPTPPPSKAPPYRTRFTRTRDARTPAVAYVRAMGLFARTRRESAPVEDVDATVARLLEAAQRLEREEAGALPTPPAAAAPPGAEPEPQPLPVELTEGPVLLLEGLRWDGDGRAVLPLAADHAFDAGYGLVGVAAELLVLARDAPAQAVSSQTCGRREAAAVVAERLGLGLRL